MCVVTLTIDDPFLCLNRFLFLHTYTMRTLKKRHNPKDQGNNEPNKEDKKPINETKDLKDSEQTAREEVYENYKAYIHHRKTD